jgi:plastocyanin
MAEPKKDSALEEQLAPQFRTGFAPGPKKATKAGPVAANVTLTDWVFIPHEVTVPVGSSVEWELKVGPHSIVADDDSFNSGLLHAPAKFTHTFETKGRHQYYCELHGSRNNQGMHGVVNVI